MSYRQILDDAIGQMPPSTIEVASIVVRQRRRMAIQRRAVAGGAAVVVVAIVAAGILGLSGALGSSPATSSAPAGPAAGLQGRLDQAIWTDLSTAAPDLSWVTRSSPTTYPTSQDWMSEWASDGIDQTYLAQGTVSSQGRIGTFLFNINVDHNGSGASCPPADSDAGKDGTCTITTGPHGESIQTEVYHYANSHPVQIEIIVDVYRSDGRHIMAENRNQSGASENDGATGADPPLTAAQLTQIALDPALTLPAGWN